MSSQRRKEERKREFEQALIAEENEIARKRSLPIHLRIHEADMDDLKEILTEMADRIGME